VDLLNAVLGQKSTTHLDVEVQKRGMHTPNIYSFQLLQAYKSRFHVQIFLNKAKQPPHPSATAI
ncbi:MAG: hypothetical protein MJ087_07475, partial [Lachnospiraceae bacterium]|nr:hypothetical protein [Lachnospiraceae bacterium]